MNSNLILKADINRRKQFEYYYVLAKDPPSSKNFNCFANFLKFQIGNWIFKTGKLRPTKMKSLKE